MFPGIAALTTYGGAKNDYSPPRDSSTDRSAAGVNPAYADVAAMTHCSPRAFVRFKTNGSSPPTLIAWDGGWKNGLNAAPVVTRSSTGIYFVTFPAIVFDEIPTGSPGATPAGFATNVRAVFPTMEIVSTMYGLAVLLPGTISIPANACGLAIATVGTSTPTDPNDGTIFGVLVL